MIPVRIFLPYILFISFLTLLFGEDKKSSKEIQKDIDSHNIELKNLRSEIKNIEERLIIKNKEATASTEILIDLSNKISLTEKLIRSLHREENHISGIIRDTEIEITKMENRLEKLKQQLTQRLQYLYIHGRSGVLETILLSNDWNSAVYRIKYLDVLVDYEKKIRLEIKEILISLEIESTKRNNELNRKTALLSEKKKEGDHLENDKKLRHKILAEIKLDKNKLEKNRIQKNQMITEMEQLLKKLYTNKKAMKKREEELARIRASKNLATTGNFSKMMGKLSWPVEGRIISRFGSVRNPETGTVTENVGIDIKAAAGTKVSPVLDGVVSTITFIRGHGNIVIIDHGGGFSTVYAHIENINVIENEYIQMGKSFAVIAPSHSDLPTKLHFEVWGNKEKLNPQKWLAQR